MNRSKIILFATFIVTALSVPVFQDPIISTSVLLAGIIVLFVVGKKK